MLELGKANTLLCAKVRESTNGMLICLESKLNQFPEPCNTYKTDRKLQDEEIVVHLQVALCCSNIQHCQPHQWAELQETLPLNGGMHFGQSSCQQRLSGFWGDWHLMRGKRFYWHTCDTLEGQKGEEEAPLARMGKGHIWAVISFLIGTTFISKN